MLVGLLIAAAVLFFIVGSIEDSVKSMGLGIVLFFCAMVLTLTGI